MNKFFYIIAFILFVSIFNTKSIAETKRDCSMYSTKNFVGLIDKINCKRGKTVKKRNKIKKFSDLNPLKTKNDEIKTDINVTQADCDTYTSKTLVGLVRKIKCKKEK